MGHKEHGGTWHMEAAQLDTQRKKGEAILKTSSTVHSTNRSSSSTRPAKLQLDRAGEVKPHLGKGLVGIEKPNIKRSLDTRSFKS
ncbi:unnamed protein product [Microthlaspi erraticum]|uniref:Uncharacterized protein n=1 Tax=Microthlaspi erraticum TaxID=1685480 RepID=A0A6D2L0K9_9BRAS|nr:unnamed protein product [Microthlaspi erraticum]